MDGERTVKKSLKENREEKKKRIHRLRWMDDVELYEEYGCKEMENKSFGQDIICI